MALKELRSWFLNRVSGQDALFSKFRKNNIEGHRVFKDGDYPDEAVFKKLFVSALFGLESEDRAKPTGSNTQTSFTGDQTVVGGHVTIATDSEAKSFSNGTEALYTRTVRPSQLPELIEPVSEGFPFSNLDYSGQVLDLENTASVSGPRNVYRLGLSKKFLNWLSSALTESTISDPFIPPYPSDDVPVGLNSLAVIPIGSLMHYAITPADSLIVGFQPKGRWLRCDGSTVGHPQSIADLTSSELKELYLYLRRLNGRSSVQALADYDAYVPTPIPTIPAILLSGISWQYIIRY